MTIDYRILTTLHTLSDANFTYKETGLEVPKLC
jgi:hypothetical protein